MNYAASLFVGLFAVAALAQTQPTVIRSGRLPTDHAGQDVQARSAVLSATATNNAVNVVQSARVCLDYPACTVYAAYNGTAFAIVGAELDVPNGFTDSQKVNPGTIITPQGVVVQASTDDYGFRALHNSLWDFGDSTTDYCQSVAGEVQCAGQWQWGSVEIDTIGIATPGRNRVEIFYPQPYPLSSLLTCDTAHKGVLQTLSTTGESYACNGTTNGRLAKMETWSGSLDFAAFASNSCQGLTFAASGAVLDEAVACGGCGSVFNGDANLSCSCGITAADTAAVTLCCESPPCANLAAITFTVTAIR